METVRRLQLIKPRNVENELFTFSPPRHIPGMHGDFFDGEDLLKRVLRQVEAPSELPTGNHAEMILKHVEQELAAWNLLEPLELRSLSRQLHDRERYFAKLRDAFDGHLW